MSEGHEVRFKNGIVVLFRYTLRDTEEFALAP